MIAWFPGLATENGIKDIPSNKDHKASSALAHYRRWITLQIFNLNITLKITYDMIRTQLHVPPFILWYGIYYYYEAFIYTTHFQYLKSKPTVQNFYYLFAVQENFRKLIYPRLLRHTYHCGTARFSLGLHKRCTRLFISWAVLLLEKLMVCKTQLLSENDPF